MSIDFKRPQGISQGVLLNTNNTALQQYKGAKKRMRKIDVLENRVEQLTKLVEQLLENQNK